MRRAIALLISPIALSAAAQSPEWQHVRIEGKPLAELSLTRSRQAHIERFLSWHLASNSDECVTVPDGPPPLFQAPALGRPGMILVTSQSCGGANTRAAWLVDLRSGRPRLLADVYSSDIVVQPATSAGLHDFVLLWHMSASETGLTLFRYNGHVYKPVSSAIAHSGGRRPATHEQGAGTLRRRPRKMQSDKVGLSGLAAL